MAESIVRWFIMREKQAVQNVLSSFWNERQGETVREGSEQWSVWRISASSRRFCSQFPCFELWSYTYCILICYTFGLKESRSAGRGITYNTCTLTLPGLLNRNTTILVYFDHDAELTVRPLSGQQINCVHQIGQFLWLPLCFIIRSRKKHTLWAGFRWAFR